MTDPRPLAGTDLAPCPDCGGELEARVESDADGQWWDIDCPACGWCAYEVESLEPFTLAGSPWTRALWAEIERLRCIKHDLDEENVQQSMAFNRKIVDAGLRVGLQKIGMGAKPCTVDDFVAEIERLRLDAEDLRLVLAAEQGRQEGAPSSGWEWGNDEWFKPFPGWGYLVARRRGPDGIVEWFSEWNESIAGDAANFRAAMQAADAAEAAAAKEPTP